MAPAHATTTMVLPGSSPAVQAWRWQHTGMHPLTGLLTLGSLYWGKAYNPTRADT